VKLPQLPERLRGKHLGLAFAVVGVIAFYIVIGKVVPHDNLQKLLEDVSNTLGAWTYLLVGGFAFLETGAGVGLIVPGETAMLLGGAVAGQGAINLYLLLAIAWFSAWAGDTTSFFIGRRLGREFVLRHGPRVGISHERFHQVEGYFDRHGGKTILLGRFISLVRALAPFVAGSSRMRYRAFVPYSVLGCGVWSAAHILIGYFFSRSIDKAAKYAGRGAFLFATLIVVIVGVVALVRYLREPENRHAVVGWMQAHSLTRPLVLLGRRLRPQARFVWNRVTPGGTFGLEFTSLMAALAVALFVLVAYTVVLRGDPSPTAGDISALHFAEDIRVGWLTSLAKGFTHLGSAAIVFPLAFAAALALALGRRWPEFWVLVAGTAIIAIGNADLKSFVDRPRPGGGLTSSSGSSFPSGHAAYSVFYVWTALTIVARLRPGMTRAALVVVAGIAISALVGLSRVYLHVHYLSDVSGGWALGVAAYSICAAVALVAGELRHNEPGAGRQAQT
jgi:membrane protein DedA with SNARE-associated domain/membrane-associated phospholipid phosphatase